MPVCGKSPIRQNQKREDVKSHHYIISFDPRDAADNGFDRRPGARIGEEILPEHFPGHWPLSVPTRTDTTTKRQYPCSHCYQFSAYRGKYPYCPTWTDRQIPVTGCKAPLHGRCYGILQSRGHGDVPPGKSLSD